jgi:uncharacterized protein (TIGR01777 family)
MRVLISGVNGLIGNSLRQSLQKDSYEVLSLGRNNSDLTWKELDQDISGSRLNGIPIIIHLAGEKIAAHRWSPALKEKIRSSRIELTKLLCEKSAQNVPCTSLLISASAIGFYGNRGEERLTEESRPGEGFLSRICQEWEAATKPALDSGIRVVQLRLGMVLSKEGGAFPKMVAPFRWGIGGRLGGGRQYVSWIMLEDVVRGIEFIINHASISGPVNLVSPLPLRNGEMSHLLAKRLHRPSLLPIPSFMLRLFLGELAEELLLSSARVHPAKLLQAGFEFKFPRLEEALNHLI